MEDGFVDVDVDVDGDGDVMGCGFGIWGMDGGGV
jgi:hypothetical protein